MQTITVDMTPGFRQPTIHYSQNDVGTTFAIDLRSRFGDTLPASPTVKIQATKPSGFGFSIEADSVVDSVATFTTVATMTDEAGRFQAELEVSDSGVVLYTANFYMEGEANPHPIGTTDGSQETIIPTLTLLVERVEAAAESVLDMTVNATTLAAGSQATYSYDEATNTATFGIPQGEAGAGAAGVTASAYSSSKTYAVGDYVIHNSNLYRCTTAITTAEAFTAAHWTQVVLGDDVTDLKSEISKSLNGLETFDQYAPFDHYGLNADGTYLTSQKYRVSCDTHIILDRPISVSVANGFKWGYIRFASGASPTWSGWFTSDVALPSGFEFVVQIARVTENASEIADVGEFLGAVTFDSVIGDTAKNTENSVTSEYILFEQKDITFGNWNDYGGISYNNGRLCIERTVPIKAGDKIAFQTNNLLLAFGIYVNGVVKEYSGWVTASSEASHVFTQDGLFFASFKKGDESVVHIDDYDAICKLYTGISNEVSKNKTEIAIIKEDVGVQRQTVELINGTPMNRYNTDCVQTSTKIPVKVGDHIRIATSRPLSASATKYIFGVYGYNSSDTAIFDLSPTQRQDLTSDFVVSDESTKYIKYAITEMDGNGNVIPVRETDFALYETISIVRTNTDNYDYSYSGDYIDIRRKKFNAIYTTITTPKTSDMGVGAVQGFAIYKGKVIQLYSDTSKLAVVDMADNSVIATMDGHVGHGNTIDFFNEFENEGDMFPLALVADGLTNEAYKVRIQTSGVTVKQTIKFPIEHCGYYVSTMLDKLNKIIYTVGYYENSYNTDSGSNKMVIAKWDYTNLTANGDGSVTPAFIESFYVPYFTTLQGPTFYNGKLFVISSKGTSPADTKIYVINPYEKRICAVIDEFPNAIKNIETEGLYFYEDANEIACYIRIITSSASLWKLEFA